MGKESYMNCNALITGVNSKGLFWCCKCCWPGADWDDCVSHATAGISVLLTQPRGRHTITLCTKVRLRSRLQIVFLSLMHRGLCCTRSLRETAEAFSQLIDSHVWTGYISVMFDDTGSDRQSLDMSTPLQSINCPSLAACFHWFCKGLCSGPRSTQIQQELNSDILNTHPHTHTPEGGQKRMLWKLFSRLT